MAEPTSRPAISILQQGARSSSGSCENNCSAERPKRPDYHAKGHRHMRLTRRGRRARLPAEGGKLKMNVPANK
jgi:hypothetical protein